MIKILLPTKATFREDVEIMFNLLESTVGKEFEIGLEIIGKAEHFQNTKFLDQIKKNIISIAQGAYNVVHGFCGADIYERDTADMRTEKGKNLLRTYLSLGRDIGANYVHIHSGAGYRKQQPNLEEKLKELKKVRETILDCKDDSNTNCLVGIENLPFPSMGDIDMDPEKVWYDYLSSIRDCLSIVDGTDLKVTLDTCHYAADKKGSIDIVEPTKKLGIYLAHLHISDVSGFWTPNKSVWKEGVMPGKGRIGEENFKIFFRHIKDNNPNIGLCLEVQNKDFKNPEESKESLKRILNWLN